MEKHKLVLIDDEADITESIADYFEEEYSIYIFNDPRTALEYLEENRCTIIISDYKMPYISGAELLFKVKQHEACDYSILLTAYAEKEMLENIINNNIVDNILEKPLNLKELHTILEKAVRLIREKQDEKETIALLEERNKAYLAELEKYQHELIGINGGLKDVFSKMVSVSKMPVNVLVTGETGTGKEMIARLIHKMSDRKNNPFISINCAAIPPDLFESELFGYKKGAFTGADKDKPGKIELANGGTLFLDEIGEMNIDLQAKLLRVLQEKKVDKLGGSSPKAIDFRLVCATNKNLEVLDEKEFRRDLFFRINDFPLYLPPLRERQEDSKALVDYFVTLFSRELNTLEPTIDKQVYNILKSYKWPGNIRELENAIKRVLIILSSNGQTLITPEHFDFIFIDRSSTPGEKQKGEITREEVFSKIIDYIIEEKWSLKDIEKNILNAILEKTQNSIPQAVQLTGIAKNKFYRNT